MEWLPVSERHADEYRTMACDEALENVINKLIFCGNEFVKWFELNYMKPNPENFICLFVVKSTRRSP